MTRPAPKVLGVLAGRDLPLPRLAEWVASAEVVLAADGGADSLVQVGVVPHYLVGDMDSVTDSTREQVPRVVEDPDQEGTDCDKLLALAHVLGYPSVVLTALEGDRPDHVLGTFHSAARSDLRVGFGFRTGIGRIVRAGEVVELDLPLDVRLSLLPLVACEGVVMEGVAWAPQTSLSPLGATSISNRARGGPMRVEMESGVAVLFVEVPGMSLWSSIDA